ncbi:MAG: carbohydrate porin [Acidobacteriia bacterium]|nr:carbohydrate porin [Terriglobia bacterium]
MLRMLCALLVCAAGARVARGQASASGTPGEPSSAQTSAEGTQNVAADDTLTLFPHSKSSRYWISGQANIILQWHPSFPANYSGPNSLRPGAENATSKLYTLYLGYALTPTIEVFLDVESAGGHGISEAFGLGGITNLDVVRNTTLSQNPYVARFMLRQIIPLTDTRIEAERDALHLATSLPARRIELRLGKFSVVDFFDSNSWGTDSHLQFLNWTVDNNGAYDYAANTRGYTDGAMIEYDDHGWSVRFAETLMPKVANGIHLDADVARARAENPELEARGNRIAHRAGAVRVLAYLNHADMGNYREAVSEYLAGKTSAPDVTVTQRQGRHKYGFGLNFEQEITSQVGVFGRLGWSDGHNESFAYTEVDRTFEVGGFAKGGWWHRHNDRAGAAFVANGIGAAHQQYLALGGLGFLLGDGALAYGPEKIFEGFYTAHLWRGFFASFDLQHVNNPGYNQARGPVVVPAVRFHADL